MIGTSLCATGVAGATDDGKPATVGSSAPTLGSTEPRDDIERWIRQLSDADFETREAADAKLRKIGIDRIDRLAEVYQTIDDYEAKVRIQRIAEYIYFWDRVIGKNGFLGISHQVYVPSPRGDPRVDPGKTAFKIVQVIPDTAAERAGLRKGDLIVSVDGIKLAEGAGPANFAELIRHKLPGAELMFEFFRGDEHITKRVAIGHRPIRHYGAAAPAELNTQLNKAVKGFPDWWGTRFGPLPELPMAEHPSPGQPLFLDVPYGSGDSPSHRRRAPQK